VHDPSDTYAPIQDFESVEFGGCQIFSQGDNSIELKIQETFLKFYLNGDGDDILLVGTVTNSAYISYGRENGWKTN
jgi:hypothetical protein